MLNYLLDMLSTTFMRCFSNTSGVHMYGWTLFPQNICSNSSINNHNNNNVSFVITFTCAIYICQQVIKIKRKIYLVLNF